MATAVADVQTATEVLSEREIARQRRWVLSIVNVSHGFNHMNSGMWPIMLGAMMGPLGFSYTELGIVSASHHIVSQGMQALYGFIAQYARRSVILGLGNTVLGITSIFIGFTQSFSQLIFLRAIQGAGSSPQHPVGSTMLSTWFGDARGRALGLHTTAGSVGSLVAIPLATFLLVFLDWRAVMVIVGIPSILLGLSYFLLRDVVRPAPAPGGQSRARAGLAGYLRCLRNRDLMLITLIMTVGAAGRGAGGINSTYLVPHFINDLGIAVAAAGALLMIIEVGGLVAPTAWGYASDKFPRKLVMQTSLLCTAVATVILGQQFEFGAMLVGTLAFYGLVVHARQAITQAMVGDYAGDDLQDAAFSIYFTLGLLSGPIWTIAMGGIMQTHGFTIATQVIALSYIAAILLMIPLRIIPSQTGARTAA